MDELIATIEFNSVSNASKFKIILNHMNLEPNNHNKSKRDLRIIKSLENKVFFLSKIGQKNKIVILDKPNYFARVNILLLTRPYKALKKNPLPAMVKEARQVIRVALVQSIQL